MSDRPIPDETVAVAQLRAFVERIERIEADIKELNGDKSEVYKELRGCGFDVKAVRQVVAKRKMDSVEREERDAMFSLYWEALTGGSRVHVHESQSYAAQKGRADQPDHDPETGELIDVAGSSSGRTAEFDSADAGSNPAPATNSDATAPEPEATGLAPRATNEPGAAAEAAGDYLREPVAAEQGQIIREGDAPRETGRHDGGDASCPDAELPETATRRLDDLGSVQDGLKMSSDGRAVERRISEGSPKGGAEDAGVTAGETAPLSNSDAAPPPAVSEQPEADPSSPVSGAHSAPQPILPDVPPAAATREAGAVTAAASPSSSEPFEPPAFLRRTAADYRPHCQNPGTCAASGLKHCHGCQKIADAAESEAA